MTFSFIPIVDAESIEKENDIVLSESEIVDLKEKFDISTETGKKEYVISVFGKMGVSNSVVEMLTDSMIENLVAADKIGSIKNIESGEKNLRSSGVEIREYKDISLIIIWSKEGNVYTAVGYCEWTDMPIVRYNDIISIDLGAGSIVNDSQELVVSYTKSGKTHNETYTKDDENYIGVGTSCSFEYDLKIGMKNLAMVISYSVTRTSNENTISLQYFHKFMPGNISVSVSDIVGISVGPNYTVTEYNLQCGTA